MLDERLRSHQQTSACRRRPTSALGIASRGMGQTGHSQLVADGDEGHEEERPKRPDVLDRELLLVGVREGEVLRARRRRRVSR